MGGAPVGTRQAITHRPAIRAATATAISGGAVDSTQVSVGGQVVIDTNGSWVGPMIAVNWTDVVGVPADLADGDGDTCQYHM